MAGFFKKIFSFGKKEVVEERIDEAAPLPPINWDALEALKPAAEQAVPEFLKREEPRPEAETPPPPPVEAEAPAPQPAPVEEAEPAPTIPPEPDIQPKPAPVEEPEEPTPEAAPVFREPAPEPEPEEIPEPEPTQPEIVQTEPPSAERGAAPHPPAGTFSPYRDREKGADRHAEPPLESGKEETPTLTPLSPRPLRGEGKGEGQREPAQDTAPAAEVPSAAPEPEAPPAEIPPPIRQPTPVEAKPVLAEIAPEPEAVPQPPPEPKPAPGKVTVTRKVEQKAEPQKAPEPAPKRSWFQRMKEGLARSSRELSGNLAGVFTKRKLDEDTLQDLEDVLIRADLGMETALRITDSLSASRYGKDVSETEVRAIMAAEVEKVLTHVAMPLELDLSHKPHVILVVGVNGTGKTTTIGKLAAKLTDGGLSVMLAAGDTFRAAAIEQLKIWGERTKSPVIASKLGADAAGLAYDAFEQARQAGSDVLIIDTAGRLQNKTELMAELEKIVRVLGKLDPEAPHTVLQTVDATTGQNALNQVEIFRNVAGVNGLVMTKLDGTARGGILVAIAAKHKLPVYFIGVGEQVDDLEPFSASEFARAIAGVA
ncbi:MAG: signal recognition particle-docking protein FtsY [Mesorhizobium sp.]|uniref:signal recognition particle-docking protein FtsY n=1 Tax=Mesorhizobium sp. TaxID=1871066 RepID=UPI000FE74868|nr:signal recognition particle-docking protein FtsY [Mesorhizobium sp.]RWM22302.1 MAG: signal recognition particle-docking protein FtsY [Mesorhizobium sp.]TIP75197.1 MAG: signal recognition particle-docking protein FtsY [Mesorhizobium sp.]TIQ11712.1 MAG: signal recognition particle-docking protein FtsY [Mesorhizobium sp.]TIR52694.1 MAG: signal recognition particle-docking protein FtsY [Mesorhizobium sp.]TJV98496.1 MAG: signal recognition particle-docking protein FtsY [Mesorhizobium sp.]